jgi:hypothetical protein
MADASDTYVVQEASKILASSDVVVESLRISESSQVEGVCLEMEYHPCKADSNDDRLEKPRVDVDVPCRWNLSQVDGLKELVPAIVKSTNLKALDWHYSENYPDVRESLLQGLYTNHTIVNAHFGVYYNGLVLDLLDKIVVMLCHNTSLKQFTVNVLGPRPEHNLPVSGFGKALGMNHTLEILKLMIDLEMDLEELVQPLIMDENGNQVNSTLTTLSLIGPSTMRSFGATIARMLRRNSSIKTLNLIQSLRTELDTRELIQSLADNHSLETLDLRFCEGVKGTVFSAIMDVLLVNFTLKHIDLKHTPLSRKGKDVVINKQLEKNVAVKELHLMELEMAKPTFARVIFCGSPYAGMSPISIGPIKQLHQFVFHLKSMFLLQACHHMETSIL